MVTDASPRGPTPLSPRRYRTGIVWWVDLRLLRYFAVVIEERHIGRAAARLRMTQPPLSRAVRHLENDLGVALLDRTPHGVVPTRAGETLYAEARSLLDRADRVRDRVRASAGPATLGIGTLADSVEHVGGRLIARFRRLHPHVRLSLHETDLADPTAGLRGGRVDIALTRTPFEDTGIATHVLGSEAVGVVVLEHDPIAARPSVSLAELTDRRWVRLPEGTDPVWAAYWTGGGPDPDDTTQVVRTIQECLQSVLWNGMAALAPVGQALPAGLVTVPAQDRPPSALVVAWNTAAPDPLVRAFVKVATTGHHFAT